jgi:ADP-ribose pyrophosphatase
MTRKDNQLIVFSTPWFEIAARAQKNSPLPYYVVQAPDCVSIIGMTQENKVLLVRQYRATIREKTLEFPSGHINKDEEPVSAAHRELLEETGYHASRMEPLGVIATDTGRLGNKLWCYFATDLTYTRKPVDCEIHQVIMRTPRTLLKYIHDGIIIHAQDIAAAFLAIRKGKLSG